MWNLSHTYTPNLHCPSLTNWCSHLKVYIPHYPSSFNLTDAWAYTLLFLSNYVVWIAAFFNGVSLGAELGGWAALSWGGMK